MGGDRKREPNRHWFAVLPSGLERPTLYVIDHQLVSRSAAPGSGYLNLSD